MHAFLRQTSPSRGWWGMRSQVLFLLISFAVGAVSLPPAGAVADELVLTGRGEAEYKKKKHAMRAREDAI